MSWRVIVVAGLLLGAAAAPARYASSPSSGHPESMAGAASKLDSADGSRVTLASGTRLRTEPDPAAPTLEILDFELELEVVERRAAWIRVRFGDRLGWVALDAEPEEEPAPALEAAPGADVGADPERLARARRALGERGRERPLGPFRLFTDVDDAELLDRLAAVAKRLPGAYAERYGIPFDPENRFAVVLFERPQAYRSIQASDGLSGSRAAAHTIHGIATLTVGGRGLEEVRPLLVHELTHLLTRLALGPELPPWLEEGIANDLAFCRVDRDGRLLPSTLGGTRTLRHAHRLLAGPAAGLAQLDRASHEGRLRSIEELLGLSSNEFSTPHGRELRYLQSAFLVRYLLDGGDPWLESALRSYLTEAAGGARPPLGPRIERAAGSWVKLDRSFRRWLRERRDESAGGL